jgi:hypothetical protein
MTEAFKEVDLSREELYNDLVNATPVDTGNMKASWTKDGLDIENSASYATEIAGGRRVVGNKTLGSISLVDGFDPIIYRSDAILDDTLGRIVR